MSKLLSKVAERHKEWVSIVKSFGEINYAEDIVQETYIALDKYATLDKILINGEVSRGYMFFSLRSIYYQYYNKRKKIIKVNIDDYEYKLFDSSDLEEQKAFHKICLMIDEEIDKWHDYDRELFKEYRDTKLSIRGIAKETEISWMSIFLTLKAGKQRLKSLFGEDYEDYINGDYDKI